MDTLRFSGPALVLALLLGCQPADSKAGTATTSPSPSEDLRTPVKEPPLPHEFLRRYDVNQDGSVSRQEFVEGGYGDLRFGKAPTDAEIARHKAGFGAAFDRLDLNRDGQLPPEEWPVPQP